MAQLGLERFNDQSWRVVTARGLHVGNLKRINGLWKFKAIGYEPNGGVVPGGGPLTTRHNTTFDDLDATHISNTLMPP